MANTGLFIGENGTILLLDIDMLRKNLFMVSRIREGHVKRVTASGAPWKGDPLALHMEVKLPERLIIEPVRGYRCWIGAMDGNLYSYNGSAWSSSGWTEASCGVCDNVPGVYRCKSYGYGCGLYAQYRVADVKIHAQHAHVWGAVEAKGRIVSHRKGFRAQYMRPVALAADEAINPKLKVIAEFFGIPLLPRDILIAEYPPER